MPNVTVLVISHFCRLTMKLQEGNVFKLCLYVHRGDPMWPLPMIHSTSPWRCPPSGHGTSPYRDHPESWPSPYWSTYDWQVGGTHPTGMLSCHQRCLPQNSSNVEIWSTCPKICLLAWNIPWVHCALEL